MECCICLNNDVNLTISPCKHEFCKVCLMKHIKRQSKCPLCRQTILSIPCDYDNNNDRKVISFEENTFAGITLSSYSTNVLKVKQLHSKDRARICGFNKGDLIVSLNGIPCKSHEEAINIINGCTDLKMDVICELEKSSQKYLLRVFERFSKVQPTQS